MERKCFPSYTFIGSAVTFGETGDDFFCIKGSEGSKGAEGSQGFTMRCNDSVHRLIRET